MIGILDTKIGNINAIKNIYHDLNIKCISVSTQKEIDNINKLIIPGIGSFDGIINKLKKNNLYDRINKFVMDEKKPVLGICIGMHIFYKQSEEGISEGFGWIKDKIIKLNAKNMRYPHMGWNNTNKLNENNLFNEINNESFFYFLHSYGNKHNENLSFVSTYSNYGEKIVSSIKLNNIYGVQFHPEKSHTNGVILLSNFAKYCD